MELHGTKNNTFHIYELYTVDGEGFKIKFVAHTKRGRLYILKKLLGFPIQKQKLFIFTAIFN
jgi:hypothetical protein